MTVTPEQLARVQAGRISKQQRREAVRGRAEAVVGKDFPDITAAELATVTVGTSLEERSALRSLVDRKRSQEYVFTVKADFETEYTRWVTEGKPANWLRRQSGNVIGIIEGME